MISLPQSLSRIRRTSSPSPTASPRSTTTARSGPSSPCISSSLCRGPYRRRSQTQHPEWKEKEPFKSHSRRQPPRRAGRGRESHAGIAMPPSHSGMTTGVQPDRQGLARHSETSRIQAAVHGAGLPAHARSTGVPAGERIQDIHRLRRRHRVHADFAERVYGVPPARSSAARGKLKFEMHDGKPVLVKLPGDRFHRRQAGKPVAIHRHIGRRPIAAFGNSDGDLQMLQWTAAGKGARFWPATSTTPMPTRVGVRPQSSSASSGQGPGRGQARGWMVVDMKKDWKIIYPFEKVEARLKSSRSRGEH